MIAVLVLACGSCSGEDQPSAQEVDPNDSSSTPLLTGPVQRLIGGSRLLGDADDFGLLLGFEVINDEYLLVGDAAADFHMVVVDIAAGEVVARFGATGEGPAEFLGPHRFHPDFARTDTWWAYDFAAWTWTPVTMVGGDASVWEIGDRYSPLQGAPVTPESPMWIGENEALVHGMFSGQSVIRATFEPTTHRVSEWSPIEVAQPFKDLPEPCLTLLNRSFIATRPSGGFAIAYQYDNWIEIRDPAGELVKKIDGPREITPDYYFTDGRFFWGEDDQNGYVGAHGIESGFYLLWCGEAECRRTMAIHQFDWDGNFIQEFAIASVTDFAISSNGDRMWGFTHEIVPPRITEWNLPDPN